MDFYLIENPQHCWWWYFLSTVLRMKLCWFCTQHKTHNTSIKRRKLSPLSLSLNQSINQWISHDWCSVNIMMENLHVSSLSSKRKSRMEIEFSWFSTVSMIHNTVFFSTLHNYRKQDNFLIKQKMHWKYKNDLFLLIYNQPRFFFINADSAWIKLNLFIVFSDLCVWMRHIDLCTAPVSLTKAVLG